VTRPDDRILIFGNSGSGKSTLARQLADEGGLAHLDLDTLAWLPEPPPRRAPLGDSAQQIEAFIGHHAGWVIEGCYTDLLEVAAPFAARAVFLNLDMLIGWIRDYTERDDVFSYRAHRDFYERFAGEKRMHSGNLRRDLPQP